MNYIQNLTVLKTYWRSGAMKSFALGLFAAALVASGAMISGCATTTSPSTNSEASQPDAVQANNSRDVVDVISTSIGTTSGGSGMVFNDAMTLASGQNIPDAAIHTESDTTTVHIATISRSFSKNGYSYQGTWTHTWTFYDANGNAMPHFVRGTTDKIVIASRGEHTVSTPRVSLADSSNGAWTISNLVADPDSATLNGTLTRAGETTKLANGKTYTHTFMMNWTNDVLVRMMDRDFDANVTYLLGTGSSDFKAVGFRDSTFERQVSFVFDGDGTATVTVTRTSGNGKVDTFTIDVRYGIWLRDIRLG